MSGRVQVKVDAPSPGLVIAPDWLAALRQEADLPPLRPRQPLWAGQAQIGSVVADLFDELPQRVVPVRQQRTDTQGLVVDGWALTGEVTAALAPLALALRDAGRAHAWRDEQLAVPDAQGHPLGTVERAVVRPLGITTRAVHLTALAPDGRCWVQQRALTKPNDPGLWDTLMGGMISAADSLETALARETWEEAGLHLAQLTQLAWGGRITTRRPSDDGQGRGYVVEHIDWYRCVVPEDVVPNNQDGEVAQFALMEADEVAQRLQQGEFTTEAALILAMAAGL